MKDPADLRFLLTIHDSPSLLAAARKLGLTPSAVTQRLQQLERHLGVRLVERSSRQLRFTDEGTMLCQRGAALIGQFDALLDDLHQRRGGFVGKLRINAPFGFGRRHIAGCVAAFQQLHPEVDIALTLSDQPLLELTERFDIVIHIGHLGVSNLVAHAIAPNARFVCAAPSFLARHGPPDDPAALAALPCIALRENNEDVTLWQFGKGRTRQSVRVAPKLSCNDGEVIRAWGVAGRGVIMRSEWDVAGDLVSGALVRLLPAWKLPDADVVALTHQRTGLPLRTRVFLDYLKTQFRPLPPWRRPG
ncbi:MAG: LysR family transcriptional regulator [Janthinobacterium lividum]